ncbi:aldehyde dehydrogenase domain-containing protein [Phlyctochytrium arcticum]|nr:aldehyde dehydrogenase domain-containing protein [Phlyctochytrium arcticum]
MSLLRKTIDLHGRSWTLETGLFINNEFVPSSSGKTFETVDPSTGKVITDVQEAGAEDVDRAVEAAQTALPAWQRLPAADRGKLLWTLADLIDSHSQNLAHLESLDNGKPVKDALGDVQSVSDVYRYYAGWADKIAGQVLDIDPNYHTYTRVEPMGVVGQIIPWNYPLSMQAWKLAPALACGNTVVMKTSEKTPLSALYVANLIRQAGFPPGVANILSGHGRPCGERIARHPSISKVAFTGSTAVGRQILIMAAESNLKKVTLELGGKSPNIVFDDAELESAVEACFGGIYENLGQNCCAGSRVFVQQGIYDRFVQSFIQKMKEAKLGNPRDPSTTFGPLVDSSQFSTVTDYISIGISEGAHLAHGGTSPPDTPGYFLSPALFTNVQPTMRIYKEEIFGPVACLVPFESEEEVLALANDSEYGLAAAVHTSDLKRAVRMEKGLKAGNIWVNCYNVTLPQLPFGGFKQSGIGRELGEYGLREYTRKFTSLLNFGCFY